MSTIYLVRHGRTALNAEGRFRGRQDAPLDEVGYKESAVAADALATVELTCVYCSPLARARDTANVIARRCGIEVIVMPPLTDLDYGAWQGLTAAEARAHHPGQYETFERDPLRAGAPGGESIAALKRRALRCLEQISEDHRTGPVAAVSHEVFLRVVLAEARGNAERFWDEDVATGTIRGLTIDSGGRWSIDPRAFS